MTHKTSSPACNPCQTVSVVQEVNMASRNQPQKRKGLTLDLNAASTKKSKMAADAHILTSPDVQMLKLSSPELENFLRKNPTLETPTPSGLGYMYPTSVTEEQVSLFFPSKHLDSKNICSLTRILMFISFVSAKLCERL